MSNSVVVALIGFGRTLEDSSVEVQTKLHVLGTLNEVSLTLDELSESGVGRSVNKLKHAPGELGSTARLLIAKWKQLLHAHMAKDSMPAPPTHAVSVSPRTASAQQTNPSAANAELLSTTKRKQAPVNGTCSPSSSQVKRASSSPAKKCKRDPCSSVSEVNSSTSNVTLGDDAFRASACRKRNSAELPESLDSTSGLSFMESLNAGVVSRPGKKKRKANRSAVTADSRISPQALIPQAVNLTAGFSNEVLSALSGDFDRPDIIFKAEKSAAPPEDFDDGDLKFKSKKILWVPKSSRAAKSNLLGTTGQSTDRPKDVPCLVDLCLDVVEHHLSQVDHVGNIPYELLARALRHASAEDLARIEICNPQYVGCSDDIWLRRIQRQFTTLPPNPSPRSGETWREFYERLSREETKRLNRIINKSASQLRKEQQSRRITLTTEAIMPRQVQRRLARHSVPIVNGRDKTHSKAASPTPVFRPYNVSHPAASANGPRNPQIRRPETDASNFSTNRGARGGLLTKLRKQFHSGRLR